MAKKQIALFLFVLAEAYTVHAQPEGNHKDRLIEWNEHFTIAWEDFDGKRPPEALGDAGTFVRISAKPFMVGNEVHYNVTAYFVKSKSWVSDPSSSLLRHEQLHFDIAELYARKIRKKVEELRRQEIHDIKIFNDAVNHLLDESSLTDSKYDLETLHGALDKTQRAWEEKVGLEMKGLNDFKKQKRTISRKSN